MMPNFDIQLISIKNTRNGDITRRKDECIQVRK
jgi:hypothetical protein